jgi:hypothetical protein
MGKNKKKRNKQYTGVDAANSQPNVIKISAVNRSKPSQWWFDNKKTMKPALIIGAVALFALVIIYEIVRLIFGW